MNIPITKKSMIKTQRLTLKPFTEHDAVYITDMLTNPEITRTFMVPSYETQEEYAELSGKLIALSSIEDTAHLEYGIFLGDTPIGFINDCGIKDDTIEIGYVVHPDYKGNGYASEATAAVLNELREMGFKTVKAGYFEENQASRRVMEKCGMHGTDEEDSYNYRGKTHRCLYCEINF